MEKKGKKGSNSKRLNSQNQCLVEAALQRLLTSTNTSQYLLASQHSRPSIMTFLLSHCHENGEKKKKENKTETLYQTEDNLEEGPRGYQSMKGYYHLL